MFSKMYSFVLIVMCGCFFGDVFGNTFFIDTNGNINKYRTIVKNNFLTDADWILESHCFSSPEIYLKCGPLKLDFVIKKKMNAEIFLNYRKSQIYITNKPKIIIQFIITFEEESIILNYMNGNSYYSYSAQGINNLQSFIQQIDENIHFKVVKIYEFNLPINRPLDNDTVYDTEIISQLRKIESSSIWKYAKEDLIELYYPNKSHTTLENMINNSTTYQLTVNEALKKAITAMNRRIFKYALLLVTYIYEALYINCLPLEFRNQLNDVFNKLSEALEKLKSSTYLRYRFCQVNLALINFYEMNIIRSMIKTIVNFLFAPEELAIYNLEETNSSKSSNSNTHILPEEILNKVFTGFSKLHETDDVPYNFQAIPYEPDGIKEKLQIIFWLIATEYENIFELD
ncbi:uncharacterized protein LOC126906970 isoform X3 [Daktulosphaira vitifoliae]|uniref:uncharacterized protein LOC126906970 isoform X3 n=1 Tax=Daktulosphaira vitifoliae TaxID=58002 RepID=UPI0021AA1E04|nr:uncharacterized protein LOC126906970 isoform X3 [Daktulosphaira vitifoliae]